MNATLERAALWDPLQCELLAAMGLPVQRAIAAAGAGDDSAMALSDDPLVLALLRAAGRTREAVDAPRIARAWPAPERLRRDPAAKRALWPQLRALRRTPA